MEFTGLIIAIVIAIGIIGLSIKLNKFDSETKAKQSKLERENQQLFLNINEQKNKIEQLYALIDESSKKLDVFSSKIQGDINLLNSESKSNRESAELLKQNLKTLSDVIKNYTDIREDSLRLNVADYNQVLDIEKHDDSVSKKKDISYDDLDSEKQAIYDLMEHSNSNLFITGKAGTGKSFLLKYFRQNTTKNALYTAPTGISALNIEGVTLHRALGFQNLQENHSVSISKNQRRILKEIDTIVIDEISMVRVDTFNKINYIFQEVMSNSEPFGGKQVIVLGDLFQLPPVANKKETDFLTDKYGGIYFFNAPAYERGNFKFCELKNIYRQSEAQFIDILNRAREGNVQNKDIEKLNEKYVEEVPARVVQVVAKKEDASRVNEINLEMVPSALHVYEAEFPDGMEDIKENDFPCSFTLELKEGALVMMIANDLEHDRWVNGTLGIVSKLKSDFIEVTINGIPYTISKKSFSTYKCEYNSETKRLEYIEDKTVIQFPVILAYAITIHKSQGMTYQRIACNLDNCFAPGQAYVALSRCADFNELYLTSMVSIGSFFTDGNLVDFYKEVSSQLVKV